MQLIRAIVFTIFSGLIALTGPSSRADTVIVRDGNVVLIRPLTSGGKDSDALLAPDGRTAYFVRSVIDPEPAQQWDGEANQIMAVSTLDGKMRTLVRPKGSFKPEENLRQFGNLALAPDGQILYFIASAWGTSGAVHALDLSNGTVSFVCPGNDLIVVQRGEHRGRLAVEKHKYMVAGGSEDNYWLVEPNGKEIGKVGENRQQVLEIFSRQ